MKKFLFLIIAALASLHMHVVSANAETAERRMPASSDIPIFISNLKCDDLLVGETGVNQNNFRPFSLWLNGYLSGLGSALPIDLLPKFRFFDWWSSTEFDTMFLFSCSKNRNKNAVDIAIDLAALTVNSVSKKPIRLRGVNGKRE